MKSSLILTAALLFSNLANAKAPTIISKITCVQITELAGETRDDGGVEITFDAPYNVINDTGVGRGMTGTVTVTNFDRSQSPEAKIIRSYKAKFAQQPAFYGYEVGTRTNLPDGQEAYISLQPVMKTNIFGNESFTGKFKGEADTFVKHGRLVCTVK